MDMALILLAFEGDIEKQDLPHFQSHVLRYWHYKGEIILEVYTDIEDGIPDSPTSTQVIEVREAEINLEMYPYREIIEDVIAGSSTREVVIGTRQNGINLEVYSYREMIEGVIPDSLTSEQVIEVLQDDGIVSKYNFSLSFTTDKEAKLWESEKWKDIGEKQTLADAGVVAGARIQVSPKPSGSSAEEEDNGLQGVYSLGPALDILTIAASVSSIVQVILMVADMWSRKTKKQGATAHKKQEEHTSLDKIYKIRVQMDDGSWVTFDAWHKHPEQVKIFVRTFTTSSPRPFRVEFLFGFNKLRVGILDNLHYEQQIDEIIRLLQQ